MIKKKKVFLSPALIIVVILSFLFCGGRNPIAGTGKPDRPDGGFEPMRFDFGEGNAIRGFIKVEPEDGDPAGKPFGIISQQTLETAEIPGIDHPDKDFILSEGPFLFLVDVPEGNYNVKITAGGIKGDSRLTVKAESRRLMVMNLEIPRGEVRTIEFTTNVRNPEMESGRKVRLKPREIGHFNWDKKLSIEFSGDNPAISSVEISHNDSAVTVFLAGNSTVTDQRYEPYSAWGQMLPVFFKPALVSVANHAESGEALKSFVTEGRLEKLMDQIRPGDYLLIQFAHNDQKPRSSAYSPPFSDYQDYLRRYIRETRERGAIPVLVTPMLRRNFDDNGRVVNTHGDYPESMRQVAESEEIAMIDLFEMSRQLYETLGPENSKQLFVHYPVGTFPGQDEDLKDNSHHSTYGAYELAKCIVEGIRESRLELAGFLLDDLPGFDPSRPDPFNEWDLPRSPAIDLAMPEGR